MSSSQHSSREDVEVDCDGGEPPEADTSEERNDDTDNRPLVVVSDPVITTNEGTVSSPDGQNETLADVACKPTLDSNKDVGTNFMGDAAITSAGGVGLVGLPEGDGQRPVVVAAVPYAPLKVPSFSGDDTPFQEVILNDDSSNHRPKPNSALDSVNILSHDEEDGESHLVCVGDRPSRSTRHVTFSISPISKSSTSIKTASSFAVEVDICRICHLGPEQSGVSLVSPCLCSGTVEFTHHSCLTKWLAECGATNCELCGYKYRFERITAFRPRKMQAIRVTHVDRLHLLLTVCTILFFAGTASYVFWVALSNHPAAARDRESLTSQILLPIYATLDSMAIFILIYELKNTIWRLWCKWRVLNLGVVIDDRDVKMRNHIVDLGLEVKEKSDKSQRLQELNYLIQEERMVDEANVTGEGDGSLVCRMIPDYETNIRINEEQTNTLSNVIEIDNGV